MSESTKRAQAISKNILAAMEHVGQARAALKIAQSAMNGEYEEDFKKAELEASLGALNLTSSDLSHRFIQWDNYYEARKCDDLHERMN